MYSVSIDPDELIRRQADLERRYESLRAYMMHVDERLVRVENSIVFRILRGIGASASVVKQQVGKLLLHSPLRGLYTRFVPAPAEPYAAWAAAAEASLSPRPHPPGGDPLISVVVPVYRPRPEWLQEAIDSVLAQRYTRWQLCLALDGPDSDTEALVRSVASRDSRIRFTTLARQSGISAALNSAGALASGDYVAFLDHDDVLAPFALDEVVATLNDGPADVLYSDEDLLTPTGRAGPILKPDWSPDLLLSCMYMGHLLVVSRAALEHAAWFRPDFDGAQDYDLMLRLDETGARFRHVPRILYHWRTHEGSTTARASSKPYAHQAGRRALAESLQRRGEPVSTIVDGPIPHTYRPVRRVAEGLAASIVIVSRNARLVGRCLESLKRTQEHLRCEYVVVHHCAGGPDPAMDAVLKRFGCVVVPYPGAFNFSAMNNLGAQHATGEVLLFLNDDVTALEPGWDTALLAQALRPCIGVAGARLLYPSGAVQHAGIVLGMGLAAGHPGRNVLRSDLWPWLDLTRDVSAVTGACIAVRRSVWDELHGFDEGFPSNFNDVDLCLRARDAGYRVVLESAAVLRHDEAQTRVAKVRFDEYERFYVRWHDRLNDPFYSPSLTRASESIALR